jgi:RNA polymerase II-associated factor 1
MYDDQEISKPTRILLSHRELTQEEVEERKEKMKELLQQEVEDDEF